MQSEAGVCASVGGAAGGALGSLIGAGPGLDVAIAAGPLAGIVGGQCVQSQHDQPRPAQSAIVRLDSGVIVAVTQAPPDPRIEVGLRVAVIGSGGSARISPL